MVEQWPSKPAVKGSTPFFPVFQIKLMREIVQW